MTNLERPLRLGFIGGALHSAVGYTHFVSSQMDNRWRVVAGCFSRDARQNLGTAEHWGIDGGRVYGSWRDLLESEREDLDAVAILTPTPQHSETVSAALDAGYPVICEKALATSSSDAHLIVDKVYEQDGFLAVTYNYSGYPAVRELREKVRAGVLGRIQHIHVEMPQESYVVRDSIDNPKPPQSWRLQDPRTVPMVSLDLGVHVHHLIEFLTEQKPLEVVAHQASYGNFNNVVDNILCIAKYTDNIVCNIWFGKTSCGARNGLRVRVYGSEGSAEWLQEDPESLLITDIHGRREITDRASPSSVLGEVRYNRFKAGHPAGFIEAFANLYTDIADALLVHMSGANGMDMPYVYGAGHAAAGLELLEAIHASATNNHWRKITEEDADDEADRTARYSGFYRRPA